MDTKICVHYSEQYDGSFPLRYDTGRKVVDFVAWLNGVLEEIPEAYRETATIEIESVSSYEDSHYATIQIDYIRPETAEETETREGALRHDADRRRAQELRTLAELQAKYAPAPDVTSHFPAGSAQGISGSEQ